MSTHETSPRRAWMGTAQAAKFLGVSVVMLRRYLERNARRGEDGTVIACADGIKARKLGRAWRVHFSERWYAPFL